VAICVLGVVLTGAVMRIIQATQFVDEIRSHGGFVATEETVLSKCLALSRGIDPNAVWAISVGTTQNVDDMFVKQCTTFRNLRELDIGSGRSKFTDASLLYLSRCQILSLLDVGGSRITDDGLSVMATWRSLRTLNISGCAITAAGITVLADSCPLERLFFVNSDIDIAMADAIAEFRSLRVVDLSGARVSETSLARICSIGTLRTMDIRDSSVRCSDVMQLRRSVPLVDIWCTE
jgi:hypothetical protein